MREQAERLRHADRHRGHRRRSTSKRRPFVHEGLGRRRRIEAHAVDHRHRRQRQLPRPASPRSGSRTAASAPAPCATARCRASATSRSIVVGGGDSAAEEGTTSPSSPAPSTSSTAATRMSKASTIMAERLLSNPKVKPRLELASSRKCSATTRSGMTGVRVKNLKTGETHDDRRHRHVRRDRPHAQHEVPQRPGGDSTRRGSSC